MDEQNGQSRAQSPELAAGDGFTFEDAVSAYFLAALLGENYAPGVENCIVSGVKLQQRNFGEPLDDVIVDFLDMSGAPARLSLQVKRRLIISAAATNEDFRAVVRDSWATRQKTDFRKNVDRYGAAVGDIARDKERNLVSLAELARNSVSTAHFETRFADGGNASAELKELKEVISSLLYEVKGTTCTSEEVHDFLAHFVLLRFDYPHVGACDPAETISSLRECLASDQAGMAPLLWTSLRQATRNAATKAGQFDRPRLVRELSQTFHLRAAPSLREDMGKLTALTRSCVADIQNDVGGQHLDRKSLALKLEAATTNAQFVQITGLPGSGKSVLLRQSIDAALMRGPVMLLKPDRLEGKSWMSFAATNGLSGAPLPNLLAEVAATGSSTLYIDGIDRVEKENRPIVIDVIRAILTTPFLDNWKIVVSLRDTGIEPLRNWLGNELNAVSIGTVEVGPLDDEEAEALAHAKPALRALLFGQAQVREIVRRPFFARILNQQIASDSAAPAFQPQSEVDLIDDWWKRGGYNADGQDALNRQRAIIDIGARRARHLSRAVPLSEVSDASAGLITPLVDDGILQHAERGHTVKFSHDIFFEWSFFHVLADRGEKWLDEIQECGEPPAVARVVELKSQTAYRTPNRWSDTVRQLETSKMRSQWTRAWLLGPVASSAFEGKDAEFSAVVTANDFAYLKKALVWFQAERTTPNSNILQNNELQQDQRIKYADMFGWPSDITTWRRFSAFLFRHIDAIPVTLYPDIVSVFEVWQNGLAGIDNWVSRKLLSLCATWLREIDALSTSDEPSEASRWRLLKETSEFRSSLRSIILHSARYRPELVDEYLRRVIASDDLRNPEFKEVVAFSHILATTHPQLLTDLTLKHLKEDLPDDIVAKDREDLQRAAERRAAALAKPETERTRDDVIAINHSHSLIGIPRFSTHDWGRLSIEDDSQNFFPTSPLREPFHSLFSAAPEHAISLVKELSNHAVSAWRQLHEHMYESPGTPLPLEISFPWGVQQFWGGSREYTWCRGLSGPQAIACAYMALDNWCFQELERGKPVDELIQRIVSGNQSIAILGTAVMLALHSQQISETVFALITTQRLWGADQHRWQQDFASLNAYFIGFRGRNDTAHVNAIKAANARPPRKLHIRSLVPAYIFSEKFSERTKAAIDDFKNKLPFELEEERQNTDAKQFLMKQALEYAELGDIENYRARTAPNAEGMMEIEHVSPSALTPESQARREEAGRYLQAQGLMTWASNSLDKGIVEEPAKIPTAIAIAKTIDNPSLFLAPDDRKDLGIPWGAVTATAAVVLRFREARTPDELTWARDILTRALPATETRDSFWSPMSVIPWHHCIFVAQGIAADLRYETGNDDSAAELLLLVAHPLECVSQAAISEVATLWDKDPKLVWAAFHLAFDLCRIEPRPHGAHIGHNDAYHTQERIQAALKAACECYEHAGWTPLPLPPPAWVKADSRSRYGRGHDLTDDDVEEPTENWTEPEVSWHAKYAADVLGRLPVEQMLSSDAKDALVAFMSAALRWTNQKNAPPWVKAGRRNSESSRIYEWTHQIGSTLGRVLGRLPLVETQPPFLDPVFALEGDTCWAILAPLVSAYICRYIYDAETMPGDAIDFLLLCLDRFLTAPVFKRSRYRSGEFSGMHEPDLARSLMFISVEQATGAARYVNGDWSAIGTILPIIDRFVRAAGWSPSVTGNFLTLCERAKAHYPAETYADQILSVIATPPDTLTGWRGTTLPARIAGLVQHFANRETPMPQTLGEKLLRILDILVDMGDRRSAALQQSENFREIKIS